MRNSEKSDILIIECESTHYSHGEIKIFIRADLQRGRPEYRLALYVCDGEKIAPHQGVEVVAEGHPYVVLIQREELVRQLQIRFLIHNAEIAQEKRHPLILVVVYGFLVIKVFNQEINAVSERIFISGVCLEIYVRTLIRTGIRYLARYQGSVGER